MSIASKHAYRFGYLKSDKWKAVRLDALVRERAKCQICAEESISNDAHHIWYPEDVYDTTEAHLVILCRPCHDFLHSMIPECKTRNEATGRANWVKYRNAIITWRTQKEAMFNSKTPVVFTSFTIIQKEIELIKRQLFSKSVKGGGAIVITKECAGTLFKRINDLVQSGAPSISNDNN